MTDRDNGGPAFPFCAEYGHTAACGGMSLRDYFATHAMSAMLSGPEDSCPSSNSALVIAAYAFADGMLAERQRK